MLIRAILRKLPLPAKHKIKRAMSRIPFTARWLLGTKGTRLPDVYILSYPKCGRTWLRLMLGKALALHFGLDSINPLQIDEMASTNARIPTIKFTHDDQPNLKNPAELSASKAEYKGKKVIFLVRDVRDVVVSYYFELTRRQTVNPHYPPYQGNISSFLRHDQGSVDTIIRYYNLWAENRYVPAAFLLIRYEDMVENTEQELCKVLNFLDLPEVQAETIHQAVESSRFDNMRKLEESGELDSFRLQPGNKKDPESYKTRRGKVQGFVDYLSEDDIEYLNQKIKTQLSDYYRYE
jgi:hypothetical protein